MIIVRQTYLGIRKDGMIYRGAIGVVPQDISPTLATALGLDRDSGVILSDIMPQGQPKRPAWNRATLYSPLMAH